MTIPFAVTVDLVVLTIRDGALQLLLVRRGIPPYQGSWALPGGFVRHRRGPRRRRRPGAGRGDRADPAGRPPGAAGQLRHARPRPAGAGGHGRLPGPAPDLPDPGGRQRRRGRAAAGARSPTGRQLAFDHDRILADGLERARAKLEYTPLATRVLPAGVHDRRAARRLRDGLGHPLDPRNFHRKVTGTPGFVSPAGRATEGDRGRPAQLFRRGPATRLHPPMLRPEP